MRIPSIDLGGEGLELLFLHANGYPPECYLPMLTRLAEKFHVSAMVQRPLWSESRPEEIEDWRPLTADLLRYLDTHHSVPIACVGHSMGGIALIRAALREPERFKAIVLLDPVLFPPYSIMLWKLIKRSKLLHRLHPLVAGARRRRRQFDNLERLFKGYRRKSVFRHLDDDALRAYIEGIACKRKDGGYQLCYSAEWEIRIYLTGIWRDMDIWRGLPKLVVPTLIVRGAETDTFREQTGSLAKRRQPRLQLETLEKSTHLLPLERPVEVSEIILSFLQELT